MFPSIIYIYIDTCRYFLVGYTLAGTEYLKQSPCQTGLFPSYSLF